MTNNQKARRGRAGSRGAIRWARCLALILGLHAVAGRAAVPDPDWPMLGHDAGRSGTTAAEIRPPFERKWYRLFPDEGLMAGIQPIVAGGRVYAGTMHGVLHALDVQTGQDVWTFQAGGPILHTCAVAAGRVYFGDADGRVYAVNALDGKSLWSFPTGAAVWNSPAVYNGLVLCGSRDGQLYAIDAVTGHLRWAAPTGAPVLQSPAVDTRLGRVYVGSEDMRVSAFALADGRAVWRSEKLPGVSLRGYHPVVAPDGSVMVTTTPGLSLNTFDPILLDMVKAIFGDFASWRHKKEENDRLREQNFKLLAQPGTYDAEMKYLRQRLTDQPAYQTFFVLDPATGRQKFVTPIVYAESMNGTGMPPLVLPDGKVVVKYQALLRSRYEHYSPFLNVGYLDTATGDITPIMDQTRTYGWHDSLLLVHDEASQLVAGGRVLINTHQDNVNAMDLDTLKGYESPFSRNIHEPAPGEALGIWARVLRHEPLPVGKEWLERGTAVYGGGSAIDVPVTIAGDSFYYLPTHEINAGAAIIAYKMQPGGTASQQSPPPTARLTDAEWQKVQDMPWDWDTLELPRLDNVPAALLGKVPGTRQLPLTEPATTRVAVIPDAELDRFIWETAANPGTGDAHQLAELRRAVRELIATEWRPLLFPAGKFPEQAYRFFNDPSETLYTLALAYPYLDAALQGQVRQRVQQMSAPGGPGGPGGALAGPTGQRIYKPDAGAVRSLYDVPPENLLRIEDDIPRSEVARLYPLWLWAHTTGDWSRLSQDWKALRDLVRQPPNPMAEDCRNGYVAGLIAYCRIARRLKDDDAMQQGMAAARTALRERLIYELAHTRGGVISQVPVQRCIFSRWAHLTPEVGRLCATYAGPIERHLMDVYVDYHRPTWWLAWNVETMMRNESNLQFPTIAQQVFTARALIGNEQATRLHSLMDLPWCKGDEFYIQKLALTLNAGRPTIWQVAP